MIRKILKLLAIFILFQALFCGLNAQDVALERIKIQTVASKLRPEIQNPIKQFKYRRIDRATVRDVETNVQEQLNKQGFFLNKIDSVRTVTLEDTTRGEVIIFVNPGKQFLLGEVQIELPDTLREDFQPILSEIAAQVRERPFNVALQNHILGQMVSRFEENGYPLCKIKTRDFKLDSLSGDQTLINLVLQIFPGDFVRLADLKVSPKSQTGIVYLKRILGFHKEEVYDERRIQKYLQILRRQDFIKSLKDPQLLVVNDLYSLYLNFEEASPTTLDGIVGYVPPAANDPADHGNFTGQLKVGLRNIFGTGRRLNVDWQKPNKLSEEFRINYREPFVLGFPFHLGGELHRLIRDTTYIEWEYSANLELPLNENLSGLFRFYSRQVYPDSLASRQKRYPQTKSVHTEFGLKWDSRDNLFNPSSGWFLSMLIDYGKQNNLGPAYLLAEDSLQTTNRTTRFKGELGLFLKSWRKQVLALNFHSVLVGAKGNEVRLPDMFWFGGAATVRGFREQQFFTDRVGWLNMEYRFLIGPRSRFFVFNDLAYYRQKSAKQSSELLIGYGLGLRFPGPLGIMQVDYGLARGEPFREGKIHFRLINQF